MRKKLLVGLVSLTMVASMLAGCGDKKDSETTTEVTTAETTTATTIESDNSTDTNATETDSEARGSKCTCKVGHGDGLALYVNQDDIKTSYRLETKLINGYEISGSGESKVMSNGHYGLSYATEEGIKNPIYPDDIQIDEKVVTNLDGEEIHWYLNKSVCDNEFGTLLPEDGKYVNYYVSMWKQLEDEVWLRMDIEFNVSENKGESIVLEDGTELTLDEELADLQNMNKEEFAEYMQDCYFIFDYDFVSDDN